MISESKNVVGANGIAPSLDVEGTLIARPQNTPMILILIGAEP